MKRMKLHFHSKSKLETRFPYNTDDNLIDVCQKQFLKQNQQFLDLQSHLRAFLKGVNMVTDTIENMYSSFRSIYESNWEGNLEFNKICQESIKIWRSFIADIKSNVLNAADEYGNQFPEMKRSIDRRNKKLSELNKQKKVYENYRNSKSVEETKVKKAKDAMDTLEKEYKSHNNELKNTLPTFCDKRIQVYVDLWTKLFEAEEAIFSFLKEGRKNQLKVLSSLKNLADNDQYSIRSEVNPGNRNETNLLSTKAYAKSAMSLLSPDQQFSVSRSFERGSLTRLNTMNGELPDDYSHVPDDSTLNRAKSYQTNFRTSSENMSNLSISPNFTSPSEKVSVKKRISFTKDATDKGPTSNKNNTVTKPQVVNKSSDASDIDEDNLNVTLSKNEPRLSTTERKRLSKETQERYQNNNLYEVIDSNSYLYKVVATFDYQSQDKDELDLKKSDIVLVLPWRNEEEMEEGWLFGENINTKEKGLFPENHTVKVDS